MKTLLIYPLLSLFLTSACGSTKETASSESPKSGTTTTSTTMATPHQDPNSQAVTYRLIVSFISIGEGTDATGREIMDGVLNSWKEKKGKPVEMESIPWGREGEVDFCFTLKELSEKEQSEFADQMKSVFKDKNLIQITENQPCVHKR
jgi:hypothetical protein